MLEHCVVGGSSFFPSSSREVAWRSIEAEGTQLDDSEEMVVEEEVVLAERSLLASVLLLYERCFWDFPVLFSI